MLVEGVLEMAHNTISIKYSDVEFHPEIKNAREDLGDIAGLMQSIREVGLRTPLWVLHQETKRRPQGVPESEFKRHRYYLVAGFRRYEAIKRIQEGNPGAFDEIEVTRFKGSVAEAQVLNITENIQREDLSPVEIANAVLLLLNLGFKQNEIAQKIGKSPTWVSNAIEFRRAATPQLRDAVQEGKISYVLGRQIASLNDGEQREKVSELTEGSTPSEDNHETPDPKKGRAADIDIRTKIRESSSRIIRPTIGELRQQLAALRVRQVGRDEFGDYELGLLVGMEWCLGEKKTLQRPKTDE